MEMSELQQLCMDAIDNRDQFVILVVPGPPGRGATRRLYGNSGPRGEVLNMNKDGDTVCRFDAVELLKFIRIRFAG